MASGWARLVNVLRVATLMALAGACASRADVEKARADKNAAKPESPDERAIRKVLPEVRGVSLGMMASELTAARPTAYADAKLDGDGHFAYREGSKGHTALVYLVSKKTMKLERIQESASSLATTDIEPRIQSQIERFGPPMGVWDCPALPGSLPTRRYAWRERDTAWMDSYLFVGERVAATLYVSDLMTIRQSLADARCVPTPPERAALFPTLPNDPRAVKVAEPTP